MASPPILDIDALLEPIGPGDPTGRSLTYEPEYDELREARRAEDDTLQGDWQRKAKVAEWDRVIELGTEDLERKTKDLQIAAWLTEALVHLHGFAGLRDGFRLMSGLQERFWDGLYPEIEDGDLEPRAAPYEFLNQEKLLPFLIRCIPLTAGLGDVRYSYLRYKESRETDNAVRKDPEQLSALQAEGKITSEQFDKAVAQSPLGFYEGLIEDLRESTAAFTALDQDNDRRFGREAPSLVGVRKALDDCRKLIEPILAAKAKSQPEGDGPAQEPEPAAAEEAPAAEGSWDVPEDAAASEPGSGEAEAVEGPEDEVPVRRRPRVSSSGGPIADADDARWRILEAASYLRQNEPGSPVPYLVVRALRLGELYGLPRPLDPSDLASPPSEVRQALRSLAAEQQWSDLLEEAEAAIGRPEGRAWLDAQRLAIVALEATEAPEAAEAARGLLRALLVDFPDLPEAELSDGTPAANGETRAWLEAEIRPGPGRAVAPEEPYPMAPGPPETFAPEEPADADTAPPDAAALAREAVAAGRMAEGLLILQQAIARATTGREKFVRALQLTELCLAGRQDRLALPLAEDLASQIDHFHLEQWESPELIARAWGALYHCLRGGGDGEAGRLPPVFARLCRLDISRALRSGGDGAG